MKIKKILYSLILGFLGLILSACLTRSAALNPALCVENNPLISQVDAEAFRVEEGVGFGQFSFEGRLAVQREVVPFGDDWVDGLYLVVAFDDSLAFDYFYNLARQSEQGGHFINRVLNGELYFRLGFLDGVHVKSSAYLSEATEGALYEAYETQKTVRVDMLMGVFPGMGASEYSVLPCLISVDKVFSYRQG